MATIFSSGLETEVDAFTTEWTTKVVSAGNALTVSSEAGEFNSGSKGAKIVADGTGANCYATKTFTEGGEFYFRVYFKLPSGLEYDPSYKVPISFLLMDGTSALAYAWVRSDVSNTTFHMRFAVRDAGTPTTVYTGSADSIATNTWNYIEMHWVVGTGANGGLAAKINGVEVVSDFNYDCAGYAVDTVRCGISDGKGANLTGSQTIYFDDVEVNDSGWLGPVGGGVSVDITPSVLTTDLVMLNPVVGNPSQAESWDMGPYIYTEAGTGVAITPPLLQTQLQMHDPAVYAVDVPTAVAPPLLQTNIQMLNPTVNVGKFRNRICSMLHLIMGR